MLMGAHRRRKWRIYQLLSQMGVVDSKSEAVDLARNNLICVDGIPIQSLHYQVNPRKQMITVKGKKIELKENRRYFVFNKPYDVLSTKKDILSFFDVDEDLKKSMFPVGRLDKNSSGLLIVTNDGRLGDNILNPKTKRKKVYEVTVAGSISEEDIEKLKAGVWIKTKINDEVRKYKTLPCGIKLLKKDKNSKLEFTLYEGKKRQIRLMCQSLNYPVISLKRIAISKLELGNLKPGKHKEIDKESLYKLLFE